MLGKKNATQEVERIQSENPNAADNEFCLKKLSQPSNHQDMPLEKTDPLKKADLIFGNGSVEVWSDALDAEPAVKMNIGLGCTLLYDASGWNKENNQELKSTGSESGCGYMLLFNPRLGKPKAWILKRSRRREDSLRRTRALISTRSYLAECSKTKADHFGVGQTKHIVLP